MKRAALLGLIAYGLPTLALAAAPRTFGELATFLIDILNSTAAMLIAAGLVIYLYGISTNLFNVGGEGVSKMRSLIIWGIIVLFVMVSIWGILQILQNTIFGSNPYYGGASAGGSTNGFTTGGFKGY